MTFIYFCVCTDSGSSYDRKTIHMLNRAAAYGMICHMLSTVYHIPVEKIRFSKAKSGRPLLLYPDEGLNISVSYSDKIAVSAISCSSVGIDIEKVSPLKADISDYADFFSDEELKAISAFDCIAESFAAMWTRKEAYLKRRGEGISSLKKAACSDSSIKTIMLNSSNSEKYSFSYCGDDEKVWLYRYSNDTIGKLLEIYDLVTRSMSI